MKEKLTIKQEKFIQNIVKGESQREAYKNAFKANYKNEAIDTKASQLFNTDKVQKRYKELLNKMESKSIMTANERKKWLSNVIKGEIKIRKEFDGEITEYEPFMSDRIKALDILNKMDGQYIEKVMNIEPPQIRDDI